MNKQIPTENEIKKLHLKNAKGKFKKEFFDLVWTHSNIVKDISLNIAKKLKKKDIDVNTGILVAGALLHDIGVYRCYFESLNEDKNTEPYIRHGVIGEEIILRAGYSSAIARFAAVHIGTGFTKENILRENLPLPKKDYLPETIEEEIVAYADQFHTKEPSFVTFNQAMEKLSKFDNSKVKRMNKYKRMFGIPDLRAIKIQY